MFLCIVSRSGDGVADFASWLIVLHKYVCLFTLDPEQFGSRCIAHCPAKTLHLLEYQGVDKNMNQRVQAKI